MTNSVEMEGAIISQTWSSGGCAI